MQKGYKREARGMAVLRCFIGLIIVIIVILLAYFMLRLDYSDKLDPNTSMRPYVEVTPTPEPTATPEVTNAPALIVNTNAATNAPSASATVAVTKAPTQAPTEAPTPEPTPEATATPAPTSIPESVVAPLKFSGFELPSVSGKTAQMGITHSFRSVADNYKYLNLKGYAYIDDASYDGEKAALYLVIIRSTGHTALALPTRAVNGSGIEHSNALCANPGSSDFEIVIDVSKFPDDSYTLGMLFNYKDAEGQSYSEYCLFPTDMSFSVLSGQVISDVKTVSAE